MKEKSNRVEDKNFSRTNSRTNNNKNYNYEFASETTLTRARNQRGNRLNNSRYQYEFGNEYVPQRTSGQADKNSPLARGENLQGAFTNGDSTGFDEEFATEMDAKSQQQKRDFQKTLKQNYNVEFAEDDLLENCDNCECDECGCK